MRFAVFQEGKRISNLMTLHKACRKARSIVKTLKSDQGVAIFRQDGLYIGVYVSP
jgi:hypothetical protein